METSEIPTMVQRASSGDEAAWTVIVDEFSPLLYAVVRGFRMAEAQRADAVQTTWLRLVEHLDDIRDPARLAGWLRTTATRVCLETLREARRESPAETVPERDVLVLNPDAYDPDNATLRLERVTLVREALTRLSERDQTLMTLLSSTTPLSYKQIAARLDMPVGSIGPTRGRILQRLRGILESSDFTDLAIG